MRTASAQLISLLSTSREFFSAELYTFDLSNGTSLYYTSLDIDVAYGGHTYLSKPLLIRRNSLSWKCGVEVDKLELDLMPTTAQINGMDFLPAARLGGLDGAWITLQRLFFSSFSPLVAVGAITLFKGRVSDIDIEDLSIKAQVASVLVLLNVQWPLYVYSTNCVWPLYGTGCGLVKASWRVTGSVVSADRYSAATNLTEADGYFTNGWITFTSGACSGVRRTISAYTQSGGDVAFSVPLPSAPAAADTFEIFPGCDHTYGTCTNKFSNQAQFRGFPTVPTPETGI